MSFPSQDIPITRLQADWIKQLTADNMHLEAHAKVAELANHYKAQRVFEALVEIRDCEGEVTPDMNTIFNRWRRYLREWVKNGHGGQLGKEAYQCL